MYLLFHDKRDSGIIFLGQYTTLSLAQQAAVDYFISVEPYGEWCRDYAILDLSRIPTDTKPRSNWEPFIPLTLEETITHQ